MWFDDEHENFQSIKDEARLENVQLIGYSNANEGIPELRANYNQYDAVLLDGLFFKTADHQGTNIDDAAFGEVAKVLSELRAQNKILPWFIYSGQKSFVKDKNGFVELFKDASFAKGKVFDKNKDEDFEELLIEIKKAADTNPERIIKVSNPEIFSIFDEEILPTEVENQVLNIFLNNLPKDKSEFKAVLTNIRSVQESIFLRLENIKVLPKLDKPNYKITHLSGNIRKGPDGKYKPTTTVYQTSDIENLQKWIYFTCGTYIHHLEQNHYSGSMISNYAIDSLRAGLLELLLWFKKTYNEHK
jgi:hypothetical protein